MPPWLLPVLAAGAGVGSIVTAVMTALGWRAQRRLADRQSAATRELEGVKAELALVSRLRTSAEEKRAEVAAEALLAALDVLDSVRIAAEVVVLQGDPDHQEGEEHLEWMRRRFEVRWADVRRYYRRFLRRRARAEVYLPDDAVDLLDRVKKFQRAVQVNQEMFCIFKAGDVYFSKGWGPEVQKQVDAMRAEVKQVLRPYAQLAASEPAAAARTLPAPDGQPAAKAAAVETAGRGT